MQAWIRKPNIQTVIIGLDRAGVRPFPLGWTIHHAGSLFWRLGRKCTQSYLRV